MAAPQIATRAHGGVRVLDAIDRLRTMAARVGLGLLVVLVITLAVAPVALVVLGYRPAVIDADVMAPALHRGDLVVNEPVAASAVETGDVVTYSDTNRGGATFTERVVTAQPYGGSYVFSSRTDSDAAVHHWSAPASEQVERLAYKVPGHPGKLLASPTVQGALVALVAGGLGVGLMRRR